MSDALDKAQKEDWMDVSTDDSERSKRLAILNDLSKEELLELILQDLQKLDESDLRALMLGTCNQHVSDSSGVCPYDRSTQNHGGWAFSCQSCYNHTGRYHVYREHCSNHGARVQKVRHGRALDQAHREMIDKHK